MTIRTLIAQLFSPSMRTASQRQIDRETAAIQCQVPSAASCYSCNGNCRQGRDCPAVSRAGCDVEQFRKSRSVSQDWAKANARHAIRQQLLDGTVPVNPYQPTDAEYVVWAIELAEYRTAQHYLQPQFQQQI
jgi:hypothetical protein